MRKQDCYLLALSLLQLTVGGLAAATLLTKAQTASGFQLAMWIGFVFFGFFLGGKGMVRFARTVGKKDRPGNLMDKENQHDTEGNGTDCR